MGGEQGRPQAGHGLGAVPPPVHPGLVQAAADQVLAARFHHAAADVIPLGSEGPIAHPLGVVAEVLQLLAAHLPPLGVARPPCRDGRDHLFYLVSQQLGLPRPHPLFSRGGFRPEAQVGHLAQVLAGMVEVDHLQRPRKVRGGQPPDPSGAVAEDRQFLSPVLSLLVRDGGDPLPELRCIAHGGEVVAAPHALIALGTRPRLVDDADLALAEPAGEAPLAPVPPPRVAQGHHFAVHADVEPPRLLGRGAQASASVLLGALFLGAPERGPHCDRDALHGRGSKPDGGQLPQRGRRIRERQARPQVGRHPPHLGRGGAAVQAQPAVQRGEPAPTRRAVIVAMPQRVLGVPGHHLLGARSAITGPASTRTAGLVVVSVLLLPLIQDEPLQLPVHLPPDALHRLLDLIERAGLPRDALLQQPPVARYHLLDQLLSLGRSHRPLLCSLAASSREGSPAPPPNASERLAPRTPALINSRTPPALPEDEGIPPPGPNPSPWTTICSSRAERSSIRPAAIA